MFLKKISFSSLLDIVRFAAALIVLLGHSNFPFLPGYEAVIVFFVLSGYLISSTVYTTIKSGKWSWKDYLIKRLTRLYVVLIPSLLLALFIALILKWFSSNHFDFQNTLNLKTFIGNLLFIQNTTINIKCFALNNPLWSLSYEFWYYMLFPCIVLAIFSKPIQMKLLYLCISLLIIFLAGKTILLYFLIWLVGFGLFLLKKVFIPYKMVASVLLVFTFILTLVFMEYNFFTLHSNCAPENDFRKFIIDLGVAFSLASFLFIAKSTLAENDSHDSGALWKTLSGFSYTIYLTHYPMMLFLFAVKNHYLRMFEHLDSPVHSIVFWGFYYGTPILLIYYAWLVSRVTEAKTSLVKKWVFSYLSPKNS